jgi:hypothetical protein
VAIRRLGKYFSKSGCASYLALLSSALVLAGCAGDGGGFSTSPAVAPPAAPSLPVTVGVSPTSAAVPLGGMVQFTASVTNTSNTAVTWSVNGIAGGNSLAGTISSSGLYTAPENLPQPAGVTISATSQADDSVSASAAVTISSDITISVTPATASVELGASEPFAASVAGSEHPNLAVSWSVSGCLGMCGSVTLAGVYTAPQVLPSPASVVLAAQSVADPSKTATAAITVTSHFTFAVSGANSVNTGATATYTATLTPVPGSNPSAAISWSVLGAGCSGAACGTITAGGSATAVYQAPSSAPPAGTVTITAVPAADPSKAASMVVAINAQATLAIVPASATLAVDHRQTFTALFAGAQGGNVTWQVAGIPGGNSNIGETCAVASNPCQAIVTAPAGSVDYVAPAAVPTANPVTLAAVSAANPNQAAAASVTILPHITVSVSPPNAALAPASTQQFTATVLGTADEIVTWNVDGTACGGANAPCGTIDASGLYTAPTSAPSPDAISILATSSEDTSRNGSASIAITTGPVIIGLLPASILAGAAGGFTLRVTGGNFAVSGASPGSVIYAGGVARTTACPDAGDCTTTLAASDLENARNLTIQVQNPDGTQSNAVNFVVAADNGLVDATPLTPSSPAANAIDVIVVEPSTAGSLAPATDVVLSIAAMGVYSTSTNTCTLGVFPIVLQRPASGASIVDICAFSVSGLGPSLTYTITGPATPDVTIVGAQPLGLGIVDLTLSVPATALTGLRTLFVVNSNKDKAAASGALEVQE